MPSFEEVLALYPDLRDGGFNANDPDLPLREKVDLAFSWISSRVTPANLHGHSPSSYGLKHACEDEVGVYISNGTFIAAALMHGIACRRYGINAVLGISALSEYLKNTKSRRRCMPLMVKRINKR